MRQGFRARVGERCGTDGSMDATAEAYFEVAVERLDEDLDEVEDAELALGRVDRDAKVERRVRPVDDARARRVEPRRCVDKGRRRLGACGERGEELAHDLLLLLLGGVAVEFEEACVVSEPEAVRERSAVKVSSALRR